MTLTTYNQENHEVGSHFSESQIELIKNHICKGASNEELAYFIQVCKKTGLDPFSKQIYSVPRGGQRTIQVGIDGLRLIADRTGRYIPGREPTYTYDKNGNLEAATAYVKKLAKDGTWHECASTAYWSEFNAGQGLWKKMPRTMLAKCAEAACLRKCFPGEMSGIYAEDEMHQADIKPTDTIQRQQRIDTIQRHDEIKAEAIECVSVDQAKELKEMHDYCDPSYKENVLKQLTSHGIAGWSKVPITMFQRLIDDASENAARFKITGEVENE